jgi:cyclophilin family peptidyl-prolyl cis-trans isomerase
MRQPLKSLSFVRHLFDMQKIRAVLLSLFTLALLAGCGGTGFPPQVTAVKAQVLQYGRTATIYVGGVDLRSNMVADLGGGCTSPAFASSSTTETLVLNCTVTAIGDLPLTLKSATGELVYSTTLNVPTPRVQLTTASGNITLELDPTRAPVTVKNFLSYVHSGYYKDTLFHRVIAGFMVQGGGYTSGMVKKTGQLAPIALESNKGLSNLRGTLAMARTDAKDSATSEFFINVVDNTYLDYQSEAKPGYAVFGKVVQGMEVVDTIATQATGTSHGYADVPLTDVTITLAQQIQ